MNARKRAVIFLTVLMTFAAMTFVIMPDRVSAADEYSNPIAAYKIGKKNYTKKFKKNAEKDYAQAVTKRYRVKHKKLHIKPGEGWEIKSIYMEYPYGQGVVGKNLKNNKKFSTPKAAHKCFYIETVLKYIETGRTVTRVVRTKGY